MFRYLNGTAEYGILFKKGESEECIGYSDSDWAGDQDDRKSTFFNLLVELSPGGVRSKIV